nr:Kruppel-like factor 18 [Oryctolagus cuniculus]
MIGKKRNETTTERYTPPTLEEIEEYLQDLLPSERLNIPGTVLIQNSTQPSVTDLDRPLEDKVRLFTDQEVTFDQTKPTADSQMTGVTDIPKMTPTDGQKSAGTAGKLTVSSEDGQLKTLGMIQMTWDDQINTPSENQTLHGAQMTTLTERHGRTPGGDQILDGAQKSNTTGGQSFYRGQISNSTGDQTHYEGQMSAPAGDQTLYGGLMSTPTADQPLYGGQMNAPNGDHQTLYGGQMNTSASDQTLYVRQMNSPTGEQTLYGGQMNTPASDQNLYVRQMNSPTGDQTLYGGQMMTNSHSLVQGQLLEKQNWNLQTQRFQPPKNPLNPLKPYVCTCPDCGKSYSKSSYLQIHKRKHTGEKPYECSEEGCPWRFSRVDALSRHKRKHSGERPYTCTKCDKSFARSDHLRQHQKVHR